VVRKVFTTLKRAFIAVGFLGAVVGVLGLIVYALFRVAEADKDLYALLFYCCTGVLFVYFAYRALRRRLLAKIILKVLRVVIVTVTVCAVIGVYALLAGIIIRRPIIGIPLTLPVLFATFYLLPRIDLSSLSGEQLS
jgi:hypothetical protein